MAKSSLTSLTMKENFRLFRTLETTFLLKSNQNNKSDHLSKYPCTPLGLGAHLPFRIDINILMQSTLNKLHVTKNQTVFFVVINPKSLIFDSQSCFSRKPMMNHFFCFYQRDQKTSALKKRNIQMILRKSHFNLVCIVSI